MIAYCKSLIVSFPIPSTRTWRMHIITIVVTPTHRFHELTVVGTPTIIEIMRNRKHLKPFWNIALTINKPLFHSSMCCFLSFGISNSLAFNHPLVSLVLKLTFDGFVNPNLDELAQVYASSRGINHLYSH